MAAPVFVAEHETTWTTNGAVSPTAFTPATGSVLAAMAGCANPLAQTISGGPTWTSQQSFTTGSNCGAQVSTAIGAGSSITPTLAMVSGSSNHHGMNVLEFSGSDGVGATAGATSVASAHVTLSITTTQDDSALVVFVFDWNAVNPAGRVWDTVNGTAPSAANGFEVTQAGTVGSDYSVFGAYYPDAGLAGSKTVGLTTSAAMKGTIVVVEVLGTASSGTPVSITPPAGVATAAATGPVISAGVALALAAGVALAAATTPAIHAPATSAPPAGAATASATPPALTVGVNLALPAGAATAAVTAPTAIAGSSVAPPAGAATASATAPAIHAPAGITPAAGAASASATVPGIAAGVVALPPSGGAAASATAPVISAGSSVSVSVSPPAGVATAAAAAPGIAAGAGLAPPAGLALAAATPPAITAGAPQPAATTSGTTTGTSATVTFPSYSPGDFLLLVISRNQADASPFTFSSSASAVTELQPAAMGRRLVALAVTPNGTGQTSLTLTSQTGTSSVWTWWFANYGDYDLTAAVPNGAGSSANDTGSTIPIPETGLPFIATGNELALGIAGVNSSATWTTDADTVFHTTTGNAALLVDALRPSAGELTVLYPTVDRGLSGTSRFESSMSLVLQATPIGTVNLLANPSFEKGATLATGWTDEHSTVNAPTYSLVSSPVTDGAVSQQMVVTGAAGDDGVTSKAEIFQSPVSGMAPGDVVTFTVDLSGSFTNLYAIIGIEGFDSGNGYLSEQDTNVLTLTGTPTRYTVTYVCPPLTDHVAVYLQTPGVAPTSAATIQMDRATLVNVGHAALIAPPAAAAVASATAPTISAGTAIPADVTPPAGAATASGTAPILSAAVAILPPAATATASATPPTITAGSSIPVDVAPPAGEAIAAATPPQIGTAAGRNVDFTARLAPQTWRLQAALAPQSGRFQAGLAAQSYRFTATLEEQT